MAAVVLVITLFMVVIAGLVSLPRLTSRRSAVWDWVYEHHRTLVVVIALAAVVFATIALMAWRRSSWRMLAWGIAPLVLVAAVLVGWSLAEHRSNVGDITDRVHQVTSVLPPTASRTAVTEGDNFRTESYVIHDGLDAVARSVWASARAHLGATAGVWGDPIGGDSPTYVAISFRGRNGCDGSVQVNVNLAAAPGGTTAEVSGSCED